MVTYVKGSSLPDGTITTTVIEQEWFKGKPFIKRCFTTVAGTTKKRNANKKAKLEKKTTEAKKEVQQKLNSFKSVEIKTEGF